MTGAQEGAEVIPFERGGASREETEEAVRLWRATRATAEVLSREEVGAMDWKRRMDAQRKALILALVEYYRKHERADVAPGVLAIITILSDNDRGCATVSQPTLAKMLGRSESSIRDAQKRLKDDGLITTGRGRFAGTSPVIPRFVAAHYNHVAWMVGALSEADKPLNLAGPPADCQSEGPAGGLNESAYGPGGMKLLNPPDEPISIRRGDARQVLSTSSNTVVDRAARIAAAVIATGAVAMPVAAHTHEPPAIVQSANQPSAHELAAKLYDAGGAALNLTNPGLHVIAVPRNWIAAGCDLEEDILPVIRAMAARRPVASISAWKYFEQAIMDAKARRTAPIAEGRAPPGTTQPHWRDEERERQKQLRAALEKFRG
jgi:hypothetical protein